MAVSSVPLASPRVSVGASASAATDTSMVPEVVAVSPPSASVEVAVTVSWKSTSLLAGGVISRLASCAGSTLATPSVTEITVPSVRESVAPSGMPETCTLSVSEPSVSVREAETERSMAVSSVPLASLSVSVGASAILSETFTSIVPVAVAVEVTLVSGSVSVLVALTVREKSVSSSVAGVMFSPDNCWATVVVVPSELTISEMVAVPFVTVTLEPS